MDRRADGRAAALQLAPADQRVPATPAAAAATEGQRRVGRLIPSRHAVAVSLPRSLRAPQQPRLWYKHEPTTVFPLSPVPSPLRPSQSEPTLAFGPPPAAARCQRAAAPPLRESADAGGGASEAPLHQLTRCAGGGAAA